MNRDFKVFSNTVAFVGSGRLVLFLVLVGGTALGLWLASRLVLRSRLRVSFN